MWLCRYRSSANFWNLPRQDSSEGTLLHDKSSRQRGAGDVAAAYSLLQRSLSCFLREKAQYFNLSLPEAWNPVAWLVVFCSVVKKNTKSDGKLVAASWVADHADGNAGPASGSIGISGMMSGLVHGGPHSQLMMNAHMWMQEGERKLLRVHVRMYDCKIIQHKKIRC